MQVTGPIGAVSPESLAGSDASRAESLTGRPRGRPRSARKRRAIIEAAGGWFLDSGFERTSMDAVARAAGVSKQTVYSHFVNKEGLFRAVIGQKVADYFPDDLPDYAAVHSLDETLAKIGRNYVRLVVMDDEAVAMFRILAMQAETHPNLVQMFFEEGPARLGATIRPVLAAAHDAGRLALGDIETAEATFCSLLRGELYIKRLLGVAGAPSAQALDAHVARCVAAFLKIYAP